MVWHAVDPRLLKQDDPRHRRHYYRDDGPLDAGELLLWLNAKGEVVRFQLSHTRYPSLTEYLAEWRRGGSLRFGEVDSGEPTGRYKMAPTICYRLLDGKALALLLDYFARNASPLAPHQRETIAAVLRSHLALARPPPAARPAVPQVRYGISGQDGGTGDGYAVSDKGG